MSTFILALDEKELKLAEDAVRALTKIAIALSELGKEGASGMGAVEALGVMVKEAGTEIGSALDGVAEAINNLPVPNPHT